MNIASLAAVLSYLGGTENLTRTGEFRSFQSPPATIAVNTKRRVTKKARRMNRSKK